MTEPRHGFESPFPAGMEQIGSKTWRLLHAMTFHARDGSTWIVPEGEETDFASVPQSLWGAFPPYGLYTASVILHDRAYSHWVPVGEMTYRYADWLLREAMRSQRVGRLRTYIMWSAVRWYSIALKRGWQGWYRDLPRMLPSLLLLPFLVLPVFSSRLLMLVLVVGESCVDWIGDRVSRYCS